MSKSKTHIRVSFPSASAETVAGSQVLIRFGKEKTQTILVECGLIQGGSTVLRDYQANSKKFAFKPKEVDYFFCCHAHSDHCGLSPKLYKEGCTSPMIVPKGNYKILTEMLYDSSKIMERDAETLSKKEKKIYSPIFSESDAQNAIGHIIEYDINTKYILDENVAFQFIPSGHIINSCQLILWIKNNNSVKKIVVTSDLGNKSVEQYYVNSFEAATNANLIIGETTYCNIKRIVKQRDREKDLEKISMVVNNTCLENKGSILIPAFSLQRFQVILTHLYDLFEGKENVPEIYAASPLACRLSELWESVLPEDFQKEKWHSVSKWSKIHFIRDFKILEDRIKSGEPTIYVCSAGMLNAGYSTYVASQLLPRSKNTILFCGFMAPGTLGHRIKEQNSKTISIDGRQIHSRCSIISLNSFTSHMQHDDLLKYYSGYNFDKIALVHGEMKEKQIFAKELADAISKNNRTGKVICVNKSTEICL